MYINIFKELPWHQIFSHNYIYIIVVSKPRNLLHVKNNHTEHWQDKQSLHDWIFLHGKSSTVFYKHINIKPYKSLHLKLHRTFPNYCCITGQAEISCKYSMSKENFLTITNHTFHSWYTISNNDMKQYQYISTKTDWLTKESQLFATELCPCQINSFYNLFSKVNSENKTHIFYVKKNSHTNSIKDTTIFSNIAIN